MIDDGLFDRFGKPNVVLGQHVAPIPAGFLGLRHGPTFAASDAVKIIMHGRVRTAHAQRSPSTRRLWRQLPCRG